MALEADLLLDRLRLKRQLGLWRLIAIALAVATALLALAPEDLLARRPHIARLKVTGLILNDRDRDETLRKVADDPGTKALIVHIDSPGGTVVGGQALYHRLRKIADKKPVVAVMGELATSAGYMIALGADHIVAQEGTLTGSIGVILQSADVTGLLEKLGIAAEAIKSAPLKAVPSPLEKLTEEGRAAARAVVLDMAAMFVDLVAERRALPREQAADLGDGRVFTGRQAVERKLIDALGGEDEAKTWLADARGISKTLPIEDIRVARESGAWRDLVSGLFQKTFLPERLTLDGLVSLWHPDLR